MDVKELKWHIRNGLIKPKYFYIPLFEHDTGHTMRIKFDYDTGGDIYISRIYISYDTYSFMHENGVYDQNYKGYAFERDTEWRFPVPDPSQWEIYPLPDFTDMDISVKNGTISSRYSTSLDIIFSTPQTLVEISGLPPGVYYISPTRPSSVRSWTYYPTYYNNYDNSHYVSHSSGYGMIDRNGGFSGFNYTSIYDSQQIGYDMYCASTKFADNTMPVIGQKQRVVRFVVRLENTSSSYTSTSITESYGYDTRRTLLYSDGDKVRYFHITDETYGVDEWISTYNDSVFRSKRWDVYTERIVRRWNDSCFVKIYDGDTYVGCFRVKYVYPYRDYQRFTGDGHNGPYGDPYPPDPPSGAEMNSQEEHYSLCTINTFTFTYDEEENVSGSKACEFEQCKFEQDDSSTTMDIAYPMNGSGKALNDACGVDYDTTEISEHTNYSLTAVSREYRSRYPGIRVYYSCGRRVYKKTSISETDTTTPFASSTFITLLSNTGIPISETLPESPGYTFDETTGALSGATEWIEYGDGLTKSVCTEYLNIFKDGYVSGGAIEIGVEN